MIIEKIINNNIVLTHDHKNREIIAMGKGIGFGRKKGDTVSESEIEKVFKIKENEIIQRLYRNEMLHDEDMIFEDMMREKYPKEFDCGKKIAKYIEVETNSKITRMEMTYLAIHIKRVTMAEE